MILIKTLQESFEAQRNIYELATKVLDVVSTQISTWWKKEMAGVFNPAQLDIKFKDKVNEPGSDFWFSLKDAEWQPTPYYSIPFIDILDKVTLKDAKFLSKLKLHISNDYDFAREPKFSIYFLPKNWSTHGQFNSKRGRLELFVQPDNWKPFPFDKKATIEKVFIEDSTTGILVHELTHMWDHLISDDKAFINYNAASNGLTAYFQDQNEVNARFYQSIYEVNVKFKYLTKKDAFADYLKAFKEDAVYKFLEDPKQKKSILKRVYIEYDTLTSVERELLLYRHLHDELTNAVLFKDKTALFNSSDKRVSNKDLRLKFNEIINLLLKKKISKTHFSGKSFVKNKRAQTKALEMKKEDGILYLLEVQKVNYLSDLYHSAFEKDNDYGFPITPEQKEKIRANYSIS